MAIAALLQIACSAMVIIAGYMVHDFIAVTRMSSVRHAFGATAALSLCSAHTVRQRRPPMMLSNSFADARRSYR